MIGPNENDAMAGMTPVFCSEGVTVTGSRTTRFSRTIHGVGSYHFIVIIQSARSLGGSICLCYRKRCASGHAIDGLMSMYLSMGANARQFMKLQIYNDTTPTLLLSLYRIGMFDRMLQQRPKKESNAATVALKPRRSSPSTTVLPQNFLILNRNNRGFLLPKIIHP